VSVEEDVTRVTLRVHEVTGKRCRLGLTRIRGTKVEPIIGCYVTLVGGCIDRPLEHPYHLLNGMVEVHAVLVRGIASVEVDRLYTSVLKLIYQVLVRLLSKTTTFLSVEIYIRLYRSFRNTLTP